MTRLSRADWVLALGLTIASLCGYAITTYASRPFIDHDNNLLGGMWAAIASVFVFKSSRASSVRAGAGRLYATGVSFALCLAYLLVFPFNGAGMAVLLGIGALIVTALGHRDDVLTFGITTIVVTVAAALAPPGMAWTRPVLRLLDTAIGVVVGLVVAMVAHALLQRGEVA
jgi:uncharacterized membrane protein YccC